MLEVIVFDGKRKGMDAPAREGRGGRKRAIKVTLRQLAVFEAIARCGSIAKAADEIALSQSAASMALRDLEYHLNVELFSREGGRLLLSDHGRLVQARAAALLRQAEELERLAPNEQAVERLRLGATPSLAYSTVSAVCSRFAALHQGVTIDLAVGPSTEIMNKVHRMSLDIGFIGCPNNRSDIEHRGWVDDPLAVFCAPGNPLAHKAGASLREFLNEPWALERAQSSERWSLTMEALKHLSSQRIVFESDSIEAVKAAVRMGDMLGCLSKATISDEVRRGLLVDLRVPELAVTRHSTIIWKKSSYQGQMRRAFLDFVETYDCED
jgi:DNA-binding transcriptional LysR family regulator